MFFVNLLPHECRVVFTDLDRIALPIFIVFFIAAGMELKLSVLGSVSAILVMVYYILLRSMGKIFGPMLFAKMVKADPKIQKYLGFGILPQAGVALGLALLAYHNLSELGYQDLGSLILTTITATTVVFEIIGPIGTRFALCCSGEATRK